MRRFRAGHFLASAVIAVIVSALVPGPAGAAPVAAAPAVTARAATARPAMARPAFPVRIKSGDGTVTIATRPKRILCLSASATQMLYAIGAGPQVVGVDVYSTWPAGAPRTKFTGAETSAEDYLSLRPDLVIVAFRSGSVIQQLQKLGVPTLLLPPATTFANVDSQLAQLGAATGHQASVGTVEGAVQADITAALHRAGGAGHGQTFYVEVDPTYYTATSKTFIGAEFSLFGMRDMADPAGRITAYPQISAEFLLKTNPDYVFLADSVCCHQTPVSFAHRPGFNALQAVRLHHVIVVNDSVASQWGPHTIETLVALLARTLRP